jgi:N6-L-threonylcarbamoyladenine synthase
VKTILALETSCDETAVAILQDRKLLASEVASQIQEHERFGGVVPEVASRNHLVQAPRLLERAIRNANIELGGMDAFAATSGPGLASSLMIGASIAKGLAIRYDKTYLAINHLEGHLLSPFLQKQTRRDRSGFVIEPNIALVVSGGHTMTVLVRAVGNYMIIGRTVDDAAGEAFDKVAKLLGLGYPGGPEIEKLARHGNANRFELPRSMLDSENFSFSGLKTAVRYLLPKIGVISNEREGFRVRSSNSEASKPDQAPDERSFVSPRDEKLLADVCASFQQAVIDVLVSKTIAAAKKHHLDLVTISGGVSCNHELRKQLENACARQNLDVKSAPSWLCTDNAAMIAFAAMLKLESGFASSVTEEINPNLALVRVLGL